MARCVCLPGPLPAGSGEPGLYLLSDCTWLISPKGKKVENVSFSAKNRYLTCSPSQAQLHYLALAYQCLTQKQYDSSKKRRPPFCVFWEVNQLQTQVRILPCSWETARTLPDAHANWSSLGNFLLDVFLLQSVHQMKLSPGKSLNFLFPIRNNCSCKC